MKRILLGMVMFITFSMHGQKLWTLQECVDHAYENNLQIMQSKLSVEQADVNKSVAWANVAPDLNFNTGYFWQFGNSIDPVTNARVLGGTNIQTSSMTLSSNWILFNGLQNTNTIKQSKLDYLAAIYKLDAMKNDVALNIASQYLQILFNKEVYNISTKQLENSERLRIQTEKRFKAGALAKGDLLQVEAQVASDEQNLIAAENALQLSLLQLAQTLQLDSINGFDIVTPEMDLPDSYLMTLSAEDIFNQAVDLQPNIKGAEMDLESAERSVAIARGGAIPIISLSAQINSNYSTRVPNATFAGEEYVPIGQTDPSGGPFNQLVYTLNEQQLYSYEGTMPFFEQYDNNFNQFIGLNLRIPIFNNLQVKRNISNSKIQMENNRIALEQEVMTFRQTIQRAHNDALASYKSYQSAAKSVESNKESFEYADKRRMEGAINQYEYENARFLYLNAISQQLQAKYDYIFKLKVLEFYLQNTLSLE